MNYHKQLEERLVRYCSIATPSDPESTTSPSTACQWDLLRELERELQQLGASDIFLSPEGHLMATLPGNCEGPVVAYLAHVDTSPQFNAFDVKPLVHRNYQGQDLVLPEDPSQVISPSDCPYLGTRIGHDIVTASGKSLLGADDKAGVAIVMTMAEHLLKNPELKRPAVRVCFTPDEEIGRGVRNLDLAKLGAEFAYTLDGGDEGDLCFETFSADKAIIKIQGVSIHPGYAKDKMVNALHLAAQLIDSLPKVRLTPDTSSDRQGFLHLATLEGTATECKLQIIIRDFEREGLTAHRALLSNLCEGLRLVEPRATVELEFVEQYRNMRYWLEKDMRPVELAAAAYEKVGVKPLRTVLRGGTDGSWLTEKGLPTPNLFTGMQNFHGPLEWVSVQDMHQALCATVELAQMWATTPAALA